MLTLMKLPTAWGLRNASAFNLKAEALLTLSGLAFDTVEALPSKGPKGKLPALIDGDRIIGDSALIQAHLERVHRIDFDSGLSPHELADAAAYRHMAEEYLYFIVLYVRWIVHPEITQDLFVGAPKPIRGLIVRRLQGQVRRTLMGQGLARHSLDEIYGFGVGVIDALAARIGDGPFFFGDRLRSIDAALYPQIVNITDAPYETPLKISAHGHANLLDYVRRCDDTIFNGDDA